MSERYGQIQEQKLEQKLGQSISHQQLLQASLVELPVMQLVDRINTEMNDNPALETAGPGDDYPEGADYPDDPDYAESSGNTEDFEANSEREERQSALDEALSSIGRDDEDLPVYHGGNSVSEEREEMFSGSPASLSTFFTASTS